ncbi:hypothetical protein D3C81_1086470 [compost metagenome]
MQLNLAAFSLNAVFRVNNFCAVIAAFDFTIGGHATAGCQAVFHRRIEVEEAHGEQAGTVTDLAGQHTSTAKTDVRTQYFTFHRGKNARLQVVYWIEAGAVFVAQWQVQQQILNGFQANFGQFSRLAGTHAGKCGEWDSIQQAAFHLRTVACMAAHHSASATTWPCSSMCGRGSLLRLATLASTG